MTKEQIGIILAMSIGDAHLGKNVDKRWNSESYFISMIHGEKQKEYIEWKSKIINSILGGKQSIPKKFNNNGYVGYRYSKTSKKLKPLYNRLHKRKSKTIDENILKYFTPLSIAIWYMDDGSLYAHKRNGKIHGYEMKISVCTSTKDELFPVVEYFKDKYDIKFRINIDHKKYYSLVCSTREIRKFMKIVKPYIEPIKCMNYKILND